MRCLIKRKCGVGGGVVRAGAARKRVEDVGRVGGKFRRITLAAGKVIEIGRGE